jgi:hypothetical protein
MNDSQQSTGRDPVDDVVKVARISRETFGQLFDHFYPPIPNAQSSGTSQPNPKRTGSSMQT